MYKTKFDKQTTERRDMKQKIPRLLTRTSTKNLYAWNIITLQISVYYQSQRIKQLESTIWKRNLIFSELKNKQKSVMTYNNIY